MKVDPFGGALFVYVGRRFNALKLIYWRATVLRFGASALKAEKYHWPRMLQEDVVGLTTEQLNWLSDGYDIWTQPHRMLKFQHVS
jgi:transposase